MKDSDILNIVEAIHLEKKIDREIIFQGIEHAILSAARKHFGEERELHVSIDRKSGERTVIIDDEALNQNEIKDLIGRAEAQTAKQVMIQKIREAERDNLYDEYVDLESQIVTGTITRMSHGTGTVNLGRADAILPRSEMISGESHRVNERIRAVVLEVSKAGSQVKIVLSRRHPDFVRRLFEIEIPEVGDNVIQVRSLAREAGQRSKVAVSCIDSKIDSVGSCVGVGGSRIKTIMEELNGERIDIVRWNDSLRVLVPNALQPAEVEDVILCPMLGKVIVLVQDDQLSRAIGRRGQNVRLASRLVGYDIDVMTQDKLDAQIDQTLEDFSNIPQATEELVEKLIEEGFFTFDDLSVIEPDFLLELSGLSEEDCEAIIDYADEESLRLEEEELAAAALKKMRDTNSSYIQKPKAPPVVKVAEDQVAVADDESSSGDGKTEVETSGNDKSENEETDVEITELSTEVTEEVTNEDASALDSKDPEEQQDHSAEESETPATVAENHDERHDENDGLNDNPVENASEEISENSPIEAAVDSDETSQEKKEPDGAIPSQTGSTES